MTGNTENTLAEDFDTGGVSGGAIVKVDRATVAAVRAAAGDDRSSGQMRVKNEAGVAAACSGAVPTFIDDCGIIGCSLIVELQTAATLESGAGAIGGDGGGAATRSLLEVEKADAAEILVGLQLKAGLVARRRS